MTQMQFVIDGVDWQGERPADTPTYLSSPHGYLVASISGAQVSYGAEHLVGKMGGLWFHPLRIGAGWQLWVDGHVCDDAQFCRVTESTIERTFVRAGYSVLVIEQMDAEVAAFMVSIELCARSAESCTYAIEIKIDTAIEGCWFGGLLPGQTVTTMDAERVVGVHASGGDISGGVAVAAEPALLWQRKNGMLSGTGDMTCTGSTPTAQTWALVCDRNVPATADVYSSLPRVLQAASRRAPQTIARPTLFYHHDADLEAYWRVARQNLTQLDAQYPGMPRYPLAGIPEYPQFFGCDTTYSIPGLLAAGLADLACSALDGLAERAQAACGRVPHEITTNGRVYHPGNAQETPQFAVACWQYVLWTGDMVAAQRWYSVCAEGMQHVAGVLRGDQWPYGDGMVERHGMGPFKLDSVCYILQALAALIDWAQALGMAAESAYWSDCRLRLAARFEHGWWISDSGLYADSLQRDGTPQLDYHWTAIVPVQTGVALRERQQIVYAQVKEKLTNEWGLVHTGGIEQSVWTLPTGLLALAAFGQGDEAYAITLLKNIGVTARHGSIGLMKELIPEGLCFVQLWSAALYCQSIVEGLLGFRPDMPTRTISLTPNLEPGAGAFRMEGLVCGDHTLDVRVHQTHIHVVHRTGSGPLHWRVADRIQGTTQPGESADFYGV